MAFTLKEELALMHSYIWHTKREEIRLRRKLSTAMQKCEESRNQLRYVLKFMRQHQNGIDVHLKKLSKTENTLREQIDSTATVAMDDDSATNHIMATNRMLIEIVQQRNDHESRLDSSQCAFKLISRLLNDETKPWPMKPNIIYELDDNISKSIEEYIKMRQTISQIQNELVQCVEKRELATYNETRSIDREELKAEVIKLAQDIHQRSGLIRQHRRNGICHLRVLVGSELITWMVKSDIVSTRYEALVLSSLLIDYGYVYCAYREPHHHNKKYNKSIKVLLNPSIIVKPVQHAIKTSQAPKTPNKLLLGSSSPPPVPSSSNASCISSSDSAPSSVVSMTASLSTISAISGTPSVSCCSLSHASNVSIANISNVSNASSLLSISNEANEKESLSFNDNNDLYRFKVDDSRIERISKMGFLDKMTRFRCKKRHYIWDGVTRQLREYKNKGDVVSLYRYSFTKETQIKPNHNDECVLIINLSTNNVLKLKAASARERDSWIRVMSDISLSHSETIPTATATATTITTSATSQYNNSYEEYRHLRMINRLKWSSLIKSVGCTSACVMLSSFRELVLNLSSQRLNTKSTAEIEHEVHRLFVNKSSPIFNLFDSFSNLFLEPFGAINVAQLDVSAVDSIITLCVDDLSSFLEIAQHRLINLLLPGSLRKENKPRPIIKLLYKVMKCCIYSKCFSCSIYKTIFPLYQRIHYEIDGTLFEICKTVHNLSTKHYHISEQLQIDSLSLSPSPFQSCFDKMKQMSHCYVPTKKLQYLVQLQQEIIRSIDNYRRQNHSNYGDHDEKEKENEEIQITDHERERGITYHIMSDDDDDDDVSLISYESAQSEKQKPLIDGNKKCKQLLIASDDMIPLFCFVLVKSQIKSVHAEIAFMNDFMSEDEKQMKAGFYLTTLQAATSALLDKKLPK